MAARADSRLQRILFDQLRASPRPAAIDPASRGGVRPAAASSPAQGPRDVLHVDLLRSSFPWGWQLCQIETAQAVCLRHPRDLWCNKSSEESPLGSTYIGSTDRRRRRATAGASQGEPARAAAMSPPPSRKEPPSN
ncbi:unnamed protein product [Lampetra fluviatilis]